VAAETVVEYAGYQGGSFRLAPRGEAMPIIFNPALNRRSTFWSLEKIISISFGAINNQFKEPFDKIRGSPIWFFSMGTIRIWSLLHPFLYNRRHDERVILESLTPSKDDIDVTILKYNLYL
jgi:hypothetical protein